MQPLLSIVVLVYNTADYLADCFDSLLGQQYQNIEIIAIDDSSTDNSLEICRAYEQAHTRFRCLTKPNEGGAVVGNLGIAMARGEYVALVDSDDLVTKGGYQALMNAAQQSEADIVVGRAARLIDGKVSAVTFLYEPFVWSRSRTVEAVSEFPDLIHDGFYWNKVFRREFLIQHGLGMVPGLLYADRPFVHRAYYLSAKTVIMTDLVYLWRSREEGAEKSITQNIKIASNFLDRMRSVAIEWNEFEGVEGAEWYRRDIAVTNLQRALHVMPGIVSSPSFRQVFMSGMQNLLALYGNLDYRPLGPRRALYLELIKRNERAGLCYLLGLPVDGNTIEIEGMCYWDQPFLYAEELDIERSVSRIDFPVIGFFKLASLELLGTTLSLTLALPASVKNRCSVNFELQAIEHEGGVMLCEEAPVRDGLFSFSVDLAAAEGLGNGCYGLILSYRAGSYSGRYRIGPSLLLPKARDALPRKTDRFELLYAPEIGGVGIRVDC